MWSSYSSSRVKVKWSYSSRNSDRQLSESIRKSPANVKQIVFHGNQLERDRVPYVVLELGVHGPRHGDALVQRLLARLELFEQAADFLLHVLRQLLLLVFATGVIVKGPVHQKDLVMIPVGGSPTAFNMTRDWMKIFFNKWWQKHWNIMKNFNFSFFKLSHNRTIRQQKMNNFHQVTPERLWTELKANFYVFIMLTIVVDAPSEAASN